MEKQTLKIPEWRQELIQIFDGRTVHLIIGLLLLLNMITLGLATSSEVMDQHGWFIDGLNIGILIIFVIEITGRILANGPRFFMDGWNLFDLIIVSVAAITYGGFFQIFRAFRIIWLFRLTVIVPQFRHLLESIVRAIPGLMTILSILCLTTYVFAIIGTAEFSHTFPQHFGDLRTSLGTVWETVLLPNIWDERIKELSTYHAYAWVYVYPAIIIINFLLLQLVIGVLLSALEKRGTKEQREKQKPLIQKSFDAEKSLPGESDLSLEGQILLKEFRALKQEIAKIKKGEKES